MAGLLGFPTTNKQVAEVLVAQHPPKAPEGLPKDFFAVRDKQERWLRTRLAADPCVVERRNHRLPGPGCCDDQMAVLVLDLALGGQDVKDLLLKRIGVQVKGNHHAVITCAARSRPTAARRRCGASPANTWNSSSCQYDLKSACDLVPEIG